MKSFIRKFTKRPVVQEKYVHRIGKRYFLLQKDQKIIQRDNLISIGLLLGEQTRKGFKPSPNLLNILKKHTSQKITLKEKKAWLFVCGRNIPLKTSEYTQGQYYLVTAEDSTVIGFGEIKGGLLVNHFDLGDFLRRESTS